jgi:hypothetical protein
MQDGFYDISECKKEDKWVMGSSRWILLTVTLQCTPFLRIFPYVCSGKNEHALLGKQGMTVQFSLLASWFREVRKKNTFSDAELMNKLLLDNKL